VVTPTDRQAKPDAADKIQRTPRDIRQFFIQPATPRPPAEPDPASRPLVKQAAPGPPAEPVPAPRPPAKHARAISDFFIQPAAPRPPAEPDPAPRPLAKQAAPAKRKAKLRPAIVALYQTADKLDYLDKRLFELPLDKRLELKSHEQAAWVNVTTPTVRQAKAEAADKIQRTQRDIREFFIRPAAQTAAPRPPAEPVPASRPLAEQAAPRPPAEPVPAPRPPAEQAHARQPIPRLRDG
jgi:hypothetical protein